MPSRTRRPASTPPSAAPQGAARAPRRRAAHAAPATPPDATADSSASRATRGAATRESPPSRAPSGSAHEAVQPVLLAQVERPTFGSARGAAKAAAASTPQATAGAGADHAWIDRVTFERANLLEVRFDDGSTLWTEPQAFARRHAVVADARAAGGAADVVRLPFDLTRPARTRGVESAASRTRVVRYGASQLTPATPLDTFYGWVDRVHGAVGWYGAPGTPAAAAQAAALCEAFERRHLQLDGADTTRLLRWQPQRGEPRRGRWVPLHDTGLDGRAPPSHVRILVHGTASNTLGSFGALLGGDALPDADGTLVLADDLARLLPDDDAAPWLLAVEHRTLTVSPLRNAADALAQLAWLPEGCRVDVLSHSRGGMVGDLLWLAWFGGARASDPPADAAAAPHATARASFESAYAGHPDRSAVLDYLAALDRADAQALRAGRHVRVAAPLRGTLLADRRTDLFLSVLLRALELAFAGVLDLAPVRALVQQLVAVRADARALPGLEAMVPGSALTRVLNAFPPAPALPGALRVVAGDCVPSGFFGGVFGLLADVFYGLHDHDLVVHTHAMFGGVPVADARSARLEDKRVNHVGYFRPRGAGREAVRIALADADTGFAPLAYDEARTRAATAPDEASGARRPEGTAARVPTVVFVPDLYASELDDVDGRGRDGWLPIAALTSRRLGAWAHDGKTLRASRVAPAVLRPLAEAFGHRGWNVVGAPYDWRADPRQAAREVLDVITRCRDAGGAAPVHVIAHGQGAVVAWLALHVSRQGARTDTDRAVDDEAAAAGSGDDAAQGHRGDRAWTTLVARGSRMLVLGAPLRGRLDAWTLQTGTHALSRLVASTQGDEALASLPKAAARWPGLLATWQPSHGPTDLLEAATWKARIGRAPHGPSLDAARAARAAFERHVDAMLADPAIGWVSGEGRTELLHAGGGDDARWTTVATWDGDGTSAWDERWPAARCWAVAVPHADLPRHAPSFAAWQRWLESGRSDAMLPRTVPPAATTLASADASAQAGDATAAPPPLDWPSLPDEPIARVLGIGHDPRAERVPPMRVSVVHGSLDYARFPLLVGHYLNDSLLGAVQRVDAKLDGQLRRAIDLKLFVGALRTSIYLRRQGDAARPPAYPGAIVLGIGHVGELTPATLSDTVARGVLRHAFEHLAQDAWTDRDDPMPLRFSTLLIGTHVQSVTLRDSLASVLDGLWRAAQRLARAEALGRPARVVEVELIEIDEANALEAAYEMRRLLERSEWRDRCVWPAGTLETRDGGLRGFRPTDADAVWQRLAIREDDAGAMRFELIAQRARVESTAVHDDVEAMRAFIDDRSAGGAVLGDRGESQLELGRLLYSMLLPTNLKATLARFEPTVLLVDERTAQLPWELLVPPDADEGLHVSRPLAVQAGMVRQRYATEFRSLATPVEGWHALVVGSPSTHGWRDAQGQAIDWPELKDAAGEAADVQRRLEDDARRAWAVTNLSGADYQTLRAALQRRPWRVLHLAGHGVVDQWVKWRGTGAQAVPVRRSGLVLSQQQVLDAGAVDRLDVAPEFVFINACHSGRDGRTDAPAGGGSSMAALASSLAMQFIAMGSKAVVATGWAISDAQGRRFANALYHELLGERGTLGEAVRAARAAVHDSGRATSNTWGAYQCYGDPLWRFDAGEHGDGTLVRGGWSLADAARSMSEHELAERVLQTVAVAGDVPAATLREQLDALVATLKRGDAEGRQRWLDSSRVRRAFGEAYREIGEHLSAVAWLRMAGKTPYSALELRHIEMAVNSLSRLTPAQLAQMQQQVDAAAAGPSRPAADANAAASQRAPSRPVLRDVGVEGVQHAVAMRVLDALSALDDQTNALEALEYAREVAPAASERECLRGSDLMRRAGDAFGLGADGTTTFEPGAGAGARAAPLFAEAADAYFWGYWWKSGVRVGAPVGAADSALPHRDGTDRRAFALSNALLCGALAAWLGDFGERKAGAGAEKARLDDPATRIAEASGLRREMLADAKALSFPHYTNAFELSLAAHLYEALLPMPATHARAWDDVSTLGANLEAAVERALVRWPSPVDLESVAFRMRLVERVLACPPPPRWRAVLDANDARELPGRALGETGAARGLRVAQKALDAVRQASRVIAAYRVRFGV